MKSKAYPSFYNNLPIWATSPPLLQKNFDTPSMIFKKTQPTINNEKGGTIWGRGSWYEYLLWSPEAVLMVRWMTGTFEFDQPCKQTAKWATGKI